MKQAAAAVFVKTPGFSPIKTRLAVSIGHTLAEEFYMLACAVVAEVLDATPELRNFYWAVADSGNADKMWCEKPKLNQGGGSLGMRLAKIYDELLQKHDLAMLLGSDAPQISPRLLSDACQFAQDGSFVIGPANDGGFYLFLGSRRLAPEIWTTVAYSHPQTLKQLVTALKCEGPIHFLPTLRDVDELPDLLALQNLLMDQTQAGGEAQVALRQWLIKQAFFAGLEA